ncbi:MAG: helix-turn-helix transcriptional regulator [Bacilli bacterium]|nr:helix-turn-helix transcriptional regulator [Bacilli bacterium]
MEFGELLRQTRISKGMSLRTLADRLGVSAPYLSDVEKGRRKPLTPENLVKVEAILGLSKEESQPLYDIAAKERDEPIAPDVIQYAGEVKNVSAALRKARELNLGDEEWLKIIEEMEKKRK